jgi:protease IV
MSNQTTWDHPPKWLLWIALPLVIGLIFSYLMVPQPVIGVIHLNDAIYPQTASSLITQIDYAMNHPEIRAVVLAFDSPGGTVVDTESVYMELERLRVQKPVVTAINGMAASGAYYLSVGSDYIYAKPTSLVGNVGAIGYLPPSPFVFEDIISSGPYKLWGAPRDSEMRQIEMIKKGFYEAVRLGRGKRLKVGPDVVLRGQIWLGTEALKLGLIDELGTENDAVRKAAEIAHVWHYGTADLQDLVALQSSPYSFFMQSPAGVTLPYPKESGLYLLYIPPMPVAK